MARMERAHGGHNGGSVLLDPPCTRGFPQVIDCADNEIC
jgi:hypothetical protein